MEASGCEPVHLLDGVMHPVEAPQHRHFVRGTMGPVLGHVGHEHGLDELEPSRLGPHCCLEIRVHRPVQGDDGEHQRHHETNGDQDIVHDEVHRVGPPPVAQGSAGMQREQLLHRNEDRDEHDQAEHQPGPHPERDEQQHEGQGAGQDPANVHRFSVNHAR